MKIHLTLFLSFCFCFGAKAQCPGTPLTLTTQTQVNSFPSNYPGCTHLNVTVTIQGGGITNLDSLIYIESISKSLFILNCPTLTSLHGLANLSNIGVELTIENCDALVSVDGLESLPFIGGSLEFFGNASLSDLSALSGVGYINGSLLITQNPALVDLSGLDNVAFTGRFLQITNNNGLTSINGLNNLTEVGNNAATIGRFFAIESNPNLTTINGLNSLVSVGTDFEVNGNGNLVSLNAFTSLATVGGEFSITTNPDLTSVLEFGSLSSVGSTLTISNNNLLSDCAAQGICDFLDGPGTAVIFNNDPGCNSVGEVEAECAAAPVELAFFNAEYVVKNVVRLEWQTLSELNNAYFQVEQSLNGHAFKPIGKVQGNGTVQSVSTYAFEHQKPAIGTNYYRLRQVDVDEKFEYSNIISVEVESEVPEIHPNPTFDFVVIKGKNLEGIARVTDLFGRIVREQNLTESDSIDLSGLLNGVYLIEIQTGNQKVTKKISKK